MTSEKRNITYVENKKVKNMRVFITVLYALQFLITMLWPFAEEIIKAGDKYKVILISPANCIMDLFTSTSALGFALNFIYSLFVIIPIVCFFFFIIDKKSNVKCFVSYIACLACSYLITFEIGPVISVGAVFALVLYVVIMFFTTILMLSTSSYNREFYSKQ